MPRDKRAVFGYLAPILDLSTVTWSMALLSLKVWRETNSCSSWEREAILLLHDIYNKLAELQQHIQHHDLHMNSSDTIQIEAPDFDLNIDHISPTTINQQSNNLPTQGSVTLTSKAEEQQFKRITPAPSHQDTDLQEIDWPDATPVEIPPQRDQQNDQRINIQLRRCNSEPVEIPQLEENLEEEQYQDLDTYLMHHNTFEASQRIC